MAIQNRRGAYANFDPSKMVVGEYAVVLSNDPNGTDGYAIYMCFAPNVVKRLILEGDLAVLLSNFASEYDSDSEYQIGSYCLYNNIIYRCTTAIGSGGEAWNSGHWTATSIGSELMTIIANTWTVSDPNNDGNIIIT